MVDASSFVAGALCLDFANTVGGDRRSVSHEHLIRYEDLVKWSVLGRTLDPSRGRALVFMALQRPAEATDMLSRAIRFREALHAVFTATLAHRAPPKSALATINEEISKAMAHACIKRDGTRYTWNWDPLNVLDAPLWPIARDAGELLTSDKLERLGECAGDVCGWVFLDFTKNRSRRWCSMKGCGNRAKVRRYRTKAEVS